MIFYLIFFLQISRLSDEIDELKTVPVRDSDEQLYEVNIKCERLQADLQNSRHENDALRNDIVHKETLIQNYDFEIKKQTDTIAYLNEEVRLYYISSMNMFE